MQTLTYVNAMGAEITFDLSAPYVFWKIDGLSLPPVEAVSTKAAGQHGYSLHGILLNERTIKITGHIHGKADVAEMYALRKKLNAVCNPVLGLGTLLYENDSGAYRIPAFPKANPYAEKMRNLQTLDVLFECPSPFFLAAQPSYIMLAYVEGGLEFPVETPNYFGFLGYQAIIDNDSDSLVPLEFMLDGGSRDPVITNLTTGQFIKLSQYLSVYDKLYINTDPEHIACSLIRMDPETNEPVSENAYGYLTHDSELFSLVPGRNELMFESADENKAVKVKINFHKRYVGV